MPLIIYIREEKEQGTLTAVSQAEKFSWGSELGSELRCLYSLTAEVVENILYFSCMNSREIHHCILQWPLILWFLNQRHSVALTIYKRGRTV